MYIVFFAIFSATVALILRLIYINQIKYKALRHIPGPSANYLWKDLLDFSKNIEKSFDTLIELNKYFGPVVKLWTYPWKPLVVIAHPKFIEKITSTNIHLEKSSLYSYLVPYLGNSSLAISDVDTWKRNRKLLSPAFQPKFFENFIPILDYHGNKLINILKKQGENAQIDLPIYVEPHVLDIICEITTNVRVNIQEMFDNDYIKARINYLTIFMNRTCSFLKRSNLFLLTNECQLQKRSLIILKKFSKYILEIRKEARKRNSDSGNGLSKTVLDLCLDAGLPESEILDHIDTFLVAGHDTSSSTIAFALYEMAQQSVIQTKVVEESISILGKNPNEAITLQDVRQMTYLESVVKETLRHYTVIPAHERLTEEDITIDGITIPKGTEVSIAVYALHHNEEYYPNPDVFNPDRFSPANLDKIQPYTYVPFAKGPRDCIGKTMAMLIIKWIIAKIIRNFELLPINPPHKVKLTSEFVLKSASGLPVKLKCRKL